MSMTFDQAAAVIPKKDIEDFFRRNNFSIPSKNPSAIQIADYLNEACNVGGDKVRADLKQLSEASAKKLGGCNCGGNCSGCKGGGSKTLNADGEAVTVVKTDSVWDWVKRNDKALFAVSLVFIGSVLVIQGLKK